MYNSFPLATIRSPSAANTLNSCPPRTLRANLFQGPPVVSHAETLLRSTVQASKVSWARWSDTYRHRPAAQSCSGAFGLAKPDLPTYYPWETHRD
eukprot:scaffold1271_cov423-Prasinococcus_capsulatus_cf.AAC.2